MEFWSFWSQGCIWANQRKNKRKTKSEKLAKSAVLPTSLLSVFNLLKLKIWCQFSGSVVPLAMFVCIQHLCWGGSVSNQRPAGCSWQRHQKNFCIFIFFISYVRIFIFVFRFAAIVFIKRMCFNFQSRRLIVVFEDSKGFCNLFVLCGLCISACVCVCLCLYLVEFVFVFYFAF